MNRSYIKILLSILLLLCLADMPYGYFQFLRFVAMVGFAFFAYEASKEKKQTEMMIYGALALLFQPFMKIAFGRTLWNIVDVIVAIGLLASLFIPKKEVKDE